MLINPSRCRMPTPARELSGTDSTVAARPCKGLGDCLVVLCSILASSSIGAPSSRIKQDPLAQHISYGNSLCVPSFHESHQSRFMDLYNWPLCHSMPCCSLSSDHCLWYDHFLWSGRRVLSPSEKETEAWSQRQQRMDELYNQASLPSRRRDPDVHVPRRQDPDVHACLPGGVQLVDELEKGLI